MSENWYYDDLNSKLTVRTLSNKMEGVFKLYQTGASTIDSRLFIMIKGDSNLSSSISVRVEDETRLKSTLDVKYRGNSDIKSFLEVVGLTWINSYLEVKPHNRMFGVFELLPPPRTEKDIPSTEDSTTRSREDLMTINYGDSKRMMVGRSVTAEDGEEILESFVKFGTIKDYFQDLSILEKANLRLYYVGDFIEGVDLEVYRPDAIWYEYGVTHANKPVPIELISNKYTINKEEKYIEFDIRDIVLRWINDEVDNFGLIIGSNNNYSTSFYTREGRLKPVISIQYITNQVYSLGRTEITGTMFVYGVGHPEIKSKLTVHSDYGYDDKFKAHLYIHRREIPMPVDKSAKMVASKPDQKSTIAVAIRADEPIVSQLTIIGKGEEIRKSRVSISKPDLSVGLTIDPNMSIKSFLLVKREEIDTRVSKLEISKPDLIARLTVDPNMSIKSFLSVRDDLHDNKAIKLAVTKEALVSTMRVIAVRDEDFASSIEIPHYSNHISTIAVSRRDLSGFLDVHTIENKEATLYIKERNDIKATMFIRSVTQIESTLDIKNRTQIEAIMYISKENQAGYLYPRALGENDLVSFAYFRQRDASDLKSYLHVGGAMGAYYFII